MYYGHGSWIAVVVFVGVFAMRMLSSQRRRRGYSRPPMSRSPYAGAGFQASTSGPAHDVRGEGPGTFTGIQPGWMADPFAKHEQRYWSGTEWTEHVADGGVQGADPPPHS